MEIQELFLKQKLYELLEAGRPEDIPTAIPSRKSCANTKGIREKFPIKKLLVELIVELILIILLGAIFRVGCPKKTMFEMSK